MKCLLRSVAHSRLSSRPSLPDIRIVRRGSAFLLMVMLGTCASAQQAIPSDIAARDQLLRVQRVDEVQQIQRMQREAQDRILNDFRERFVNEAWLNESAEKLKSLVFLPPLPPALGQTEPDPVTLTYPVALVEHVGETFFMAHGSLHFRRLLKPVHIRRIATYRETRDHLLGELREALTTAGKLPAADSVKALGEFTTRQESALRALEDQAEKIRADLCHLDDGAAVINLREKFPPGESDAQRDYFSAIHAAHFQDGLSLEQRQLLLEIAFGALLGAPSAGDSADFFLPAAARLRWPADPTGAITPLLSEFRDLCEHLKTELREQVVQSAPAGNRTKQHAALAEQQARRFDELHGLAERIRNKATGLVDTDRPAPTEFPSELVRTVGQAVADKDAFQAKAKRILSKLDREFAPLRFKLVFRDRLPLIEVQSATEQTVPPAVAQRLQQTNESVQRDFHELAAGMETARLALQRYRESLGAAAPEASKLSAQLARTYLREETWRRYADYRTAVLTPGLSPAQRRLLFNAALRDLEKHRLAFMD